MDSREWNTLIAKLPKPHLLQTWEWGQLKLRNGWRPHPLTWRSAQGEITAAGIELRRSAGFGGIFKVLYVPRGPLLDWADVELRGRVLDELQRSAQRQGAIFIKIDPEVCVGSGIPGAPDDEHDPTGGALVSELRSRGWVYSAEQVQFKNTVLVDLTAPEEELLSRMKQKTRYNIRLAERKGVSVRRGGPDEFPMLYRMYAETSLRDGFVIRDESYYRAVWECFYQADMLDPLIAEVEGHAVAGLMLFHFAEHAWYLYGMSREVHREKMPNYLLQWQAMGLARQKGCRVYDLWGAPDEFNEKDSMWGVFRFKEGLGGRVLRTPGAWDYPARPMLYHLYTRLLPRLLDLMRRRGNTRTQQRLADGA